MFLYLVSLVFAQTVYRVQQQIYSRPPIENGPSFHRFRIYPEKYAFENQMTPRNCTQSENCLLVDYVAMLSAIDRQLQSIKPRPEFFYVIEDDTYYCPYDNLLERVISANANVSIIFTGIGGSGYLIRSSLIPQLVKAVYAWNPDLMRHNRNKFGVDLLFWDRKSTIPARQMFRSRLQLNVHLYQGSTRTRAEGLPQHIYGSCFELSCGKGPVNQFDLKRCQSSDLMSLGGACGKSNLMPIGYVGRHCLRRFNLSTSRGLYRN